VHKEGSDRLLSLIELSLHPLIFLVGLNINKRGGSRQLSANFFLGRGQLSLKQLKFILYIAITFQVSKSLL
jgi:hypothetical protein